MGNFKSNVGDYELLYVSESESGKAIAVRVDEDHSMFWLPKSQIEYEDKGYKRHQVIHITIPDWLAEKHDLL